MIEQLMQEYFEIDSQIKELEETKNQIRQHIQEVLIENNQESVFVDGLGMAKYFTPKPQMRLNTKLVEKYCEEHNLDINDFKKETAANPQLRIVSQEVIEKQKTFLNNK